MKTNPSIHRLLAGVAGPIFALAAISCQTIRVSPNADVPAPVTRAHWEKVSSRPPTYYPRGVPADYPTDHWNGEWVDTGDDSGTRYFIPLHGLGKVDRRSLLQEAFSARSDKKLAQIAAEDREIRNKGIKKSIILLPINALTMMGGNYIDEARLENLEGEFKEHWRAQLAAN